MSDDSSEENIEAPVEALSAVEVRALDTDAVGKKIFFLSCLSSIIICGIASFIHSTMDFSGQSHPLLSYGDSTYEEESYTSQPGQLSGYRSIGRPTPEMKFSERQWDATTEKPPEAGKTRVIIAGKPTDIDVPQKEAAKEGEAKSRDKASGAIFANDLQIKIKSSLAKLNREKHSIDLYLFEQEIKPNQEQTPIPEMIVHLEFNPLRAECNLIYLTKYVIKFNRKKLNINLGKGAFATLTRKMSEFNGNEITALSGTREAGEMLEFQSAGQIEAGTFENPLTLSWKIKSKSTLKVKN